MKLTATRRALALLAVTVAALAQPATAAHAADQDLGFGLFCGTRTLFVRTTEGGPQNQILKGTLCYKGFIPPPKVQLLVSGATYSRWYWHNDGGSRSYVRAATNAGYTTFAVDRLGTGVSSKPLSTSLNLTAGAVALKDVVTALRGGLAGPSFTKVILVAHSLGAAHSWLMGNNADAIVDSSELHRVNHLGWNSLQVYAATSDPKWASSGLDSGYITTSPGARSQFYYNTSQTLIDQDENTKDLSNYTELAQAYTMVDSADPLTSPSRTLTKPVLVVIGDKDPFFCGGDAITCTDANVTAQEAPYYANASQFEVVVLPNIGHSLNLHSGASAFHTAALNWITSVIPA